MYDFNIAPEINTEAVEEDLYNLVTSIIYRKSYVSKWPQSGSSFSHAFHFDFGVEQIVGCKTKFCCTCVCKKHVNGSGRIFIVVHRCIQLFTFKTILQTEKELMWGICPLD